MNRIFMVKTDLKYLSGFIPSMWCLQVLVDMFIYNFYFEKVTFSRWAFV